MIRFRPGQQYKKFSLITKSESTSNCGRVSLSENKDVVEFYGAISKATPTEIEQWKQNGHPITHKVVVRGSCSVDAEDIITLQNDKFFVQGVKDCSKLNIFTVIYCEEKSGV